MKLLRIILVLTVGTFLFGDVMYEMLITTQGPRGMSIESMSKVFLKGDKVRTETTTKSPMTGEITSISITRLDKEVIWNLDTENKEYTELNLADLKKKMEQVSADTEKNVVPEIEVKKTGEKKKILNYDCEKVVLSMKASSDQGSVNFTQTMWVTKDVPRYKELERFQKKVSELGLQPSSSMLPISKKVLEEFKKKSESIKGFPLEMEMDMSMGTEEMPFSFKIHSEVSKIDAKPINAKVFEIPKGYKLKKTEEK